MVCGVCLCVCECVCCVSERERQSRDHEWLQASSHIWLWLIGLAFFCLSAGQPDRKVDHRTAKHHQGWSPSPSFSLSFSLSLSAGCQQVKQTHSTELCKVSSNHSGTPRKTCVAGRRAHNALHCFHENIQDVRSLNWTKIWNWNQLREDLFKCGGCLIPGSHNIYKGTFKTHWSQILQDWCVLLCICQLSEMNFFLLLC